MDPHRPQNLPLRALLEQELTVIGPSPGPFTKVIAESVRGAHASIERMARDAGGWVCEQHPTLGWPHDRCAGPGMLRSDVEPR